MKFSLFAHMERVDDNDSYQKMYEEFIELCQIADEGGMTTVWTGEHHGMDFTIAPNPFNVLVDIANKTKNIRLGTGTVIAPFWHPISLAGEAALVDLITNGRLELGIARGAYNYEYERVSPGLDAWQAGQKMREIIPTLRKLWQGDYEHNGEFYQFPKTSVVPKPVQQDGPPIWVAARDPSTHEYAIEHDCNIQVTPLWMGVEEIESLIQRYNEAKLKVGKGDNAKIMLLQHCYVANSNEDADDAAKVISRFYGQFGAWFKNERPVSQAKIKPLSEEELASNAMYSPEVVKQNMPVGTSKIVTEKLKHYEQLGYDEFSFWVDTGMSVEKKKASLSRFIDEVMPHF